MPRTTDVTQPPFRRWPSILLTFSSSKPSTGARLATLARGILAVILNRRLSSSFNGCRRTIAVPPFCPGTRAVGWFPPPANRSPGQGRGPPDRSVAVRLRSWGMHLSMCLGQGLWYWNSQYLIYDWWMAVGLLIPSGNGQKRSSRVGHCAFRQVAAGIHRRRSGQE